ncbi:MAG: hypothetical protein Kow00124_03730 [Anaerolineae bacterium]
MAQQALYLRWRPMTFEDVVGQEHVTYTLRAAVASGRIGHAYLFSGPRGTGKTTMARLLAKAANCEYEDPALRPCNQCQYCVAVNEGRFLDLIEIDAASHTSVDDVRELRDRIAFAPNEGHYKVYIIDEVHRFSGAAFDALLKTLEEPPAHAIFVLATTEIHKVPQTIQSRCQRFDFRRIRLGQIVDRLAQIAEAEGIAAEPEALELIARQGTGSLRDCISLLDQLMPEPGGLLTLELAQAVLGTAGSKVVQDLTDALIAGDSAAGLYLINEAVDSGLDVTQLTGQMVEHLRALMVAQTGGVGLLASTLSAEGLAVVERQAAAIGRRALLAVLRIFNDAFVEKSQAGSWQPQLPLELAFLQSVDEVYAELYGTAQAAPAPPARAQDASPAAAPAQPRPAAPSSPAPQAEAPAAPVSPAAPSVDIAELTRAWRHIVETTRQLEPRGIVQALLNSVKLYGIEGDTVILQSPSDVLKDKVEAEANRAIIEQALARVFKLPLKVRCRLGGGQGQGSRRVEELLAEDSVAAFAVNELGGSIASVDDDDSGSQED